MFHNLKPLFLLALVALPLAADAGQHRGRAQQQQQRARSARAEALAPPRQLAQTLLPAGARRVNEPVVLTRDGRWMSRDEWHRGPHADRSWWKNRRFNHYPFGSYYAVPFAGVGYGVMIQGQDNAAPESPAPAVSTTKGLLQFEMTPASGLDYYIDGIHVGSSSTLGSEFEVNAGSRQVEVRARGYKPATFDKRIEEGRVTTVRGALERLDEPQAPRSTGSPVMYVIPGCYMGNARPSAEALPRGCDIRKMVTRGL
jgi:hypothetical protein